MVSIILMLVFVNVSMLFKVKKTYSSLQTSKRPSSFNCWNCFSSFLFYFLSHQTSIFPSLRHFVEKEIEKKKRKTISISRWFFFQLIGTTCETPKPDNYTIDLAWGQPYLMEEVRFKFFLNLQIVIKTFFKFTKYWATFQNLVNQISPPYETSLSYRVPYQMSILPYNPRNYLFLLNFLIIWSEF